MSLSRSVNRQLAELGVEPEQINFVGISHYHYDHTGQAVDFANSTLLIDQRDWDVVKARQDLSASFAPWISGGSMVQTVAYDHDVFSDGSVIMLKTPGHMWKSLDLRKGTHTVERRADSRSVIGGPKTRSSYRTIPVPTLVESALRRWKVACRLLP